MEVIRDSSGNVISRSKNLRGIREYVSNHLITRLDISPIGESKYPEGKLSILFDDGSSFECNFASLVVLANFVRNWRNVWGAPLSVSGTPIGTVSYHHEYLAELCR